MAWISTQLASIGLGEGVKQNIITEFSKALKFTIHATVDATWSQLMLSQE